MIEQLVGVAYILDIQQLHQRVMLGIEMLVHIFQHRLNAYLLAIAHAPHTIEGQALGHSTLKDEDCRSSRATDEINALGIEMGDGTGEDAVVPTGEQTYTVGTYQRTAIALTGVEDALLKDSTLLGLFAETC